MGICSRRIKNFSEHFLAMDFDSDDDYVYYIQKLENDSSNDDVKFYERKNEDLQKGQTLVINKDRMMDMNQEISLEV